jgi:hypothetical protein
VILIRLLYNCPPERSPWHGAAPRRPAVWSNIGRHTPKGEFLFPQKEATIIPPNQQASPTNTRALSSPDNACPPRNGRQTAPELWAPLRAPYAQHALAANTRTRSTRFFHPPLLSSFLRLNYRALTLTRTSPPRPIAISRPTACIATLFFS